MGVDAVETHILDPNRTSQLNIQETTAARASRISR